MESFPEFFFFSKFYFSKNRSKFLPGVYSESCKAYKMELFAKIVNGLISILDIGLGSDYASVMYSKDSAALRWTKGEKTEEKKEMNLVCLFQLYLHLQAIGFQLHQKWILFQQIFFKDFLSFLLYLLSKSCQSFTRFSKLKKTANCASLIFKFNIKRSFYQEVSIFTFE